MVQATYNLLSTDYDDATASQHWLASLATHYTAPECERMAAAVQWMLQCGTFQYLDSGETIARHRLCTADILFGLCMDANTLCAALLNGCLTAGCLSEKRLLTAFGPNITRMVQDLARIDQLTNVDRVIAAKDQPEHEENLRRLLLGIAEDVRVVLIVLAERLHLMRVVKHVDRARQISLAEDTQRIYAPLANRLGIGQIKWELEDLVLRYLEPNEYKRIASFLRERRSQRQEYIAQVVELLQAEFQRVGISADISGRPKHIYSIWRKMQRKGIGFEQIFDLRALRVMVQDVPACYAALGVVHGLWPHIPQEFDDYIATPKGNMYRSLHTAVIGPDGLPVEVQIRTYDMHRHAELGVAAHWAYKEAKAHDAEFQRRVVWMRRWLELKNAPERRDDLGHYQLDCAPTHVYVLTPQAKVIELPKGATPLDFAYSIHSEIGHKCRGARVDGRIVPLNYQLNSGETVAIITQSNATPSRDWLSPHKGYLVTARARHRVRQWFRIQDYAQHVLSGRTALEKELRSEHKIALEKQLERIAERYQYATSDDVLAAIGRAEISVAQVVHQLTLVTNLGAMMTAQTLPPRRLSLSREAAPLTVVVAGMPDMLTRLAQCCQPQPSDLIIGFVTRGRGVTIHRRDCHNIHHLPAAEQERLVEAHWETMQPRERQH